MGKIQTKPTIKTLIYIMFDDYLLHFVWDYQRRIFLVLQQNSQGILVYKKISVLTKEKKQL